MNLSEGLITAGILVLGVVTGGLVSWWVRPVWLKNSALLVIVTLSITLLVYFTLLKEGMQTTRIAEPTSTAEATATTPSRIPPTSVNDTAEANNSRIESSAPNSQYLADMEIVGSDRRISADAASVNGQVYPRSIVMSHIGGCAKNVIVQYDLGRDWSTFHAVLGLEDGSDEDSEIHFQVYVDGTQVGPTHIATLGSSEDVTVNISGGLRLKLGIVLVRGNMGACSNVGSAVWGDAKISK